MGLDELSQRVVAFRDARDWKQYHTPKDLAISISLESAELLELFQWKTHEQISAELKDERKREKLSHELADIIIYCLSLSDVTGIKLDDAVIRKLAVNEAKYPVEKVKGSAKKYDEY